MSKKRRRAHTDSSAPPAPSDRKRRLRTGTLLALGAVVIAAGIVIGRAMYNRAGSHVEFPKPVPADSDAAVTSEDFVGAVACASCHASEYASWKSSTHGRAGASPPNPQSVKGPFDGRPMRFRDAVVTPSTTATGAFVFTIVQGSRPKTVLQVDAVVGGGYMVGGGTQAAFGTFPDGTLRFLPFDYSPGQHLWFCQGRANRGWIPITPAIALADCDAWPPTRILGSSERFQTCQQCHGSQIEVVFDSAAKRYHTSFTTLAINCESCHGPGRRHVELARSGKVDASADIGMRALSTLTKDQSLEVCFQCHAVKAAMRPGYLPGKRLQSHFALKLPQLLDTIYFADGRTRVFAYQEGHLSSDCYLNGSMTCVDCHDPHSQRYRDINDAPLPGRFDDGQCLDCHASKAEPLERHTRHRPTSPGSRCVSCHMPYLQESSVGPHIRYARSDHTIPIPRPAYDTRLGLENACQKCHRDRTAQQLETQVTAWYGTLKPHAPAVAALLAADSTSDAATALKATLAAPANHPMAEVAGLARVLRRPALLEFDGETIEHLERRAESTDPDVQALALATLHLVRGADSKVRRFLVSVLRGLGPRDTAIRDRWAWILRVRGDAALATGDYESALGAYRKSQEVTPDDPAVWRSLGVGYTRQRDYGKAIEHFRHSLELRPGQPQVLVELGFALMQQGSLDSAAATYRRAIALNPWEPGAYANLGITYLRGGALRPAVEALVKAVELNPGLADAHFALASAYAQLGERARATAALERGLEFDPLNPTAHRMLDAIRRQ